MHWLKYFIARIAVKLTGNDEAICRYLRKTGMQIGENCHIYSDIFTGEGFLVEIGDNVTVSNGVQLITHDNSICKVLPEFSDTFGVVKIGSNSFVGAKTVIMRGVTIPPNTIIGAGSVVTHSFTEERTIIAGNPARVVGNWENYAAKYADVAVNVTNVQGKEREALIRKSAACLQNRNHL